MIILYKVICCKYVLKCSVKPMETQ